MSDFKIFPKFAVSVNLKKHCSGCGLSHAVDLMMEPMVFENEHMALTQIKLGVQRLLKFQCPSCAQETAQVSFHEDEDGS